MPHMMILRTLTLVCTWHEEHTPLVQIVVNGYWRPITCLLLATFEVILLITYKKFVEIDGALT